MEDHSYQLCTEPPVSSTVLQACLRLNLSSAQHASPREVGTEGLLHHLQPLGPPGIEAGKAAPRRELAEAVLRRNRHGPWAGLSLTAVDWQSNSNLSMEKEAQLGPGATLD